MKDWSYRLNKKIDSLRLKEDSNNAAAWDCKECGLSYIAKINEKMKAKHSICPHCKTLKITKTDTQKIFSEYIPHVAKNTYNYDFFLNPENRNQQKWKCTECDSFWYASAYERFFERKECPYCSGKYAIPGKTSLIARYPKLIAQTWVYRSNLYICNPDTILPNTNKKCWFQCTECGHTSYISVNRYIQNYNRGISNCAHCKGLRKIKSRLF